MTLLKTIGIFLLSYLIFSNTASAQPSTEILTGADQTAQYLPLLKGKRIALIVNQTSEIERVPLPDTLLKLDVKIAKIFSPEHGFRGNASAGAHVANSVDQPTGLSVISLYGDNKKPSAEQLQDVDVVVYDLQDVGARFYTYISTLQYAMEACAEQGKPLIILDRPNPLGFMVDGPVLEKANTSFVGMQPIPIVYGMTSGEYAKMLIGEKWLSIKKDAKGVAPALQMTIISCENYTHQSRYRLPLAPSPNLKEMAAVYLYPSLCLFEGTVVSVGRGTPDPFEQFGHPLLKDYTHSFVPVNMTGAIDPPYKGQTCYGRSITKDPDVAYKQINNKLQIKWLLEAYNAFPDKKTFFTPFFLKLAGTATLRKQIEAGKSEEEIRKSWEPGLAKFKKIRQKYLLYKE